MIILKVRHLKPSIVRFLLLLLGLEHELVRNLLGNSQTKMELVNKSHTFEIDNTVKLQEESKSKEGIEIYVIKLNLLARKDRKLLHVMSAIRNSAKKET